MLIPETAFTHVGLLIIIASYRFMTSAIIIYNYKESPTYLPRYHGPGTRPEDWLLRPETTQVYLVETVQTKGESHRQDYKNHLCSVRFVL